MDDWKLEGQADFGGLILALLLGARHSGTWDDILIFITIGCYLFISTRRSTDILLSSSPMVT
jgi:hypothetical protein